MELERMLTFAASGTTLASCRPIVIVIAPARFTDNLKDALLLENKVQCKQMIHFMFCEHVDDVLAWKKQRQRFSIDYIAIVLDPRQSTCVTMAENNISKIDPLYIESGRLCFVNGGCSVPPAEMGIPHGHINTFSQKYSAMLINGDVLMAEKCLPLAANIVRLVRIATGLQTGIPMSVDIPGYLL